MPDNTGAATFASGLRLEAQQVKQRLRAEFIRCHIEVIKNYAHWNSLVGYNTKSLGSHLIPKAFSPEERAEIRTEMLAKLTELGFLEPITIDEVKGVPDTGQYYLSIVIKW